MRTSLALPLVMARLLYLGRRDLYQTLTGPPFEWPAALDGRPMVAVMRELWRRELDEPEAPPVGVPELERWHPAPPTWGRPREAGDAALREALAALERIGGPRAARVGVELSAALAGAPRPLPEVAAELARADRRAAECRAELQRWQRELDTATAQVTGLEREGLEREAILHKLLNVEPDNAPQCDLEPTAVCPECEGHGDCNTCGE